MARRERVSAVPTRVKNEYAYAGLSGTPRFLPSDDLISLRLASKGRHQKAFECGNFSWDFNDGS
jgi:hypothetical protein